MNNATLGLYAKVVQSPDYREAKRKTVADMLPDPSRTGGCGPGSAVYRARRDAPLDGRRDPGFEQPLPNCTDSWGGTRERLDEGVLGVAVATIDGANDAARFVSLELAGQLHRFSGWAEWTVKRFEISADGPVEIGIDGEALRMDPPLVFEVSPARCGRIPLACSG